MAEDGKLRRALLFLPADDARKVAKAAGMEVDSIILDLEDGVAFTEKENARRAAAEALLGPLKNSRAERLVRINSWESGLEADDLAAIIPAHPDGIVLPKVERGDDLRYIDEVLTQFENDYGFQRGAIRLMAIIETARGVVNLSEIAASCERLVALAFGAEDLAASLGAIRTQSGHEVAYGRAAVVMHAAAFNLQAIDSPFIRLKDPEGLRAETLHALEMGYMGKLAIHPDHIDIVTGVFRPAPEEVEKARALIAAHDAHQRSGSGAFAHEGRMIDMPMIRAAERVLARAGQRV